MSENDLALGDVRVLDLSENVAGPFCTKLLAELGAEVIKVEPPGTGDASRRAGPFPGAMPNPEQSALFLYLNTGKKSVTLDLVSQTGSAILRCLAQECDILVESYAPGYLEQLALGYEALERLNSGLIYTSVTPFGQSGPYRDYQGSDLIAQALGGLMQTIGLPDREPLKIGGHAALYTTGLSAFSATMMALYAREAQGYGQHVDVSAMETMAVAQIHSSIHHQFGRAPVRRESPLVRAQDGWVSPGLERGVRQDTWGRVCELIGRPELKDDPAFNTPEARREHQQDLLAILSTWTTTRPKEEIYHLLQELRSVAGYVATVEDLLASRQLLARQFFRVLDHPYAGKAVYAGAPFCIQGERRRSPRAPLLGEHNRQIYCGRLGFSAAELARLRGLGTI
ncbi:MAG TPA: CoA transferase [Candidatus Tectomicrobia bacterium]|nr:CoA transferase [Candidatus Tectomicrobia bacterium]